MINLSPWAVETRRKNGLAQVGKARQLATCKYLLQQLKYYVTKSPEMKPLPRFPISAPRNISIRYFENKTLCSNRCAEVLFWSLPGQTYQFYTTSHTSSLQCPRVLGTSAYSYQDTSLGFYNLTRMASAVVGESFDLFPMIV
jgi:hypothetical protein